MENANVASSFSSTTNGFRLCLALTLVTFILHGVGIGTDFWKKQDLTIPYQGTLVTLTMRSGLWRQCYCLLSLCECYALDDPSVDDDVKEALHGFSGKPDWHIAVQVLECLGLVGVLVFGAMVLYAYYQKKTSPLTVKRAGLLLLSGCTTLAGVIIYGAKQDHLHYSFGLCTAAGSLDVVVAFLCYKHVTKMRSNQPPQQQQFPMTDYPTGLQPQNLAVPPNPVPRQSDSHPPPYGDNRPAVTKGNQAVPNAWPTSPGHIHGQGPFKY